MRLVLFRHAERESTGGANPTLTRRGIDQAEKILAAVKSQRLPNPQQLMVSPRLRTQQSLGPLSLELKLPLQILPELDERQNAESAFQFTQRVQNFLQRCAQTQATLFMCTHLDWVEEALRWIPSDSDLLQPLYQSWQPSQFMSFQVEGGLWTLQEFGGFA